MAKENYIDINALPKTLLKDENKRLIKLMLEGTLMLDKSS